MAPPVEDSDFDIHNRMEIVFVLEDLVKYQSTITLHTAEGVNFLTTVLAVSHEDGCVYLDISQDELLNEQVLQSKRVTFALQVGVRVRWRSTQVSLVSLQDGDAFLIDVPEVIERIQRREYFRLGLLPDSQRLICKLPLAGKNSLDVPVADMSVGGIGISITGAPPAIFSQGAVLQGCSVEFPSGVVPLALKVRGIWATAASKGGEKIHHIGLEFVNLSRSAGNIVQRHMIELEKDHARSED